MDPWTFIPELQTPARASEEVSKTHIKKNIPRVLRADSEVVGGEVVKAFIYK